MKKYKKCTCIYHWNLKQESIQRTLKLKFELQQSFFQDSLIACGNDSKRKWGLIRTFWLGNKKITKIDNMNGKTSQEEMA